LKEPVELFIEAYKFLVENGYESEIAWCEKRVPFSQIDEQVFLREYAWVILNAGFRYEVIRSKWASLYKAFHRFIPFKIVEDREQVRKNALAVFGYRRKIDAIIDMAEKIWTEGFEASFRPQIEADTLNYLATLPFIGEVTKYHLARNLGFDHIKPDRHLVRLADKYGMTPFEMCNLIHDGIGGEIRLGTIDLVLWRFMEQKGQKRLT